MLFIDKIVAHTPKGLCLLIWIASVVLSIIFRPYDQEVLYTEGVIDEYIEEIESGFYGKGGGRYHHEFYYLVIGDVKIQLSAYEREKFNGRKYYWKEKFEGKYAKAYYTKRSNIILNIELEDGSYSFHHPQEHDLTNYHVGWFPFCIFAPIALFCIFVLLRYFYLQTFASDERRILVFGNKDGNLK